MNVHIALMGRTKEPVLIGYQYYGNIDKLYILHSPNDSKFKFKEAAKDVLKRLEDIGFSNVFLIEINPFDINSIVNSIIKIVEKEKDTSIYINLTGGTNLMAGAACAASFFIGAKSYYVFDRNKLPSNTTLNNQVVELPIPNIPYIRAIQETQMTILMKISELGGIVSNARIREEMGLTPQKLSYHIKELEKKGLINTRRGMEIVKGTRGKKIKKIDTRTIMISLTNSGKLITNWTSNP